MSSLAQNWWRERQFSFNALVVLSLLLAFVAFAVIADIEDAQLSSQATSQETDRELGGYALICPCCSTFIFLAATNLCYLYAHRAERFFGIDDTDRFRIRAWRGITLVACTIPPLIPLLLLLQLLF